MRVLFIAFMIVNPNPLAGPNDDWAPLMREYQECAASSTTYFNYTVCAVGVHDRAVHPTFNA